jgi:DNA-directed RNA polymerase specialized sigma24 family protein
LHAAIVSAIAGLYPPYLRRTARLRYFHELSGPDIAQRLGVGTSTIPGYLHQVRLRLRPALADLVTLPAPHGRARGLTRHIRIDDGQYAHAD